LCRLLLVSLGAGAKGAPDVDRQGRVLQVAVSWGTTGRIPNRDESWGVLSDVRNLCPSLVVEGGRLPDLDIESMNLFPEIALLANDAPTDTPRAAQPFLPRPVRRDVIDFGLVRRWFSICDARHSGVCSSEHTMREMEWVPPEQTVPAFRCVDLQQDCLVVLRDVAGAGGVEPLRYAALSYVWGRAESDAAFFKTLLSNVAQREVPGFFASDDSRKRIPRTIRDAMTVTRRLGLRYLWVDSLCIVQDNSGDDWLDAIRKMDIVYGAAYVTIIAVGSSDAFAGIAGVESGRGPSGDVRTIEQISDGLRLAFLSADQTSLGELQSVRYYTRGWT